MPSLRRMTVADLAADPSIVQRLIDEGETLFVERKERDPADGLGPTVASFANMLGGWLLIGVDDDGNVVGYSPPGTADLQDYMREVLRTQIDPLPPFTAAAVPVGDNTIGVMRVAESSDTPHVTSDGVIYVRNPGGKQRVTDHRDILEMARRGEQARKVAAERQYTLPLIEEAMRSPPFIVGDKPGREDEHAPLVEWIVRATPYTVTGGFADRALSASAVELASSGMAALFLADGADVPKPVTQIEPRARGLYCEGWQLGELSYRDLAIDAGGVVALRHAWRRRGGTMSLSQLGEETLKPLIRTAAAVLEGVDGFGRAAVALEIRGSTGILVHGAAGENGILNKEGMKTLYVGGDLAVPSTPEEIQHLTDQWVREIARAARLPMWEPTT